MRLFVAVNFTEPFRKTLLGYQNQLRKYVSPDGGKPNWTREENLHLTLAFIGEYNRPKDVIRALERIEWEPFTISPAKIGRFGSLRWAGIENGERAVRLAEAVRASLKENGIPFDEKPMKPHITLVRELNTEEDVKIIPDGTEMTVNRISLMKSERIGGKLTYTEVWGKSMKES